MHVPELDTETGDMYELDIGHVESPMCMYLSSTPRQAKWYELDVGHVESLICTNQDSGYLRSRDYGWAADRSVGRRTAALMSLF